MNERPCHRFVRNREGMWWSIGPSNRMTMVEGYCPTCGMRLHADGTTEAMVPEAAARWLAERLAPGGQRDNPAPYASYQSAEAWRRAAYAATGEPAPEPGAER